MAKLANTAQIVMDMYYAAFKTDEDFFSLYHFMYICGVAYARILEDEYKEARREAKQETGYTDIQLQADWLKEDELQVQKRENREGEYFIELPARPFTFPYDAYGFGVQQLRSSNAACANFIRTTSRIEQQLCQAPRLSRIFFYTMGNKIELRNVFCHLDKVIVAYVPEITDPQFGTDGGDIPKSKEDMVIARTYQIMAAARQGNQVIDMTNNSNPNKALQTEIDNLFTNIRTRP